MDWWKDTIEEYKDENDGNWVEDEGALQLYFYEHRTVKVVNDDIVKKVIAGMDKPQCDKVRYIYHRVCNQITDAALTTIGEHCRHLTKIFLYGCAKVTDEGIAAVLGNNPKIKCLNFSHCEKATSASIGAVIEHCPDIEELNANSVGLTSLPDNIGNLSKLKTLDLYGNIITTLPLSIGNLPEDCKLDFGNNPIKNVPFSAIEKGPTAIKRFFSATLKGAAKSNQFKIVLLGTGEAGKTSLLNALIGQRKPLTTKIQRTIHVEIREFHMQRENGLPSIKIKAYDFGGQETYALGQSQYFDDNGMYILVINADETNPQVFIAHLQRLQAMAPNAVVLVVLSKIDLLKTDKKLQDKVEWIRKQIQNFNVDAEDAVLKKVERKQIQNFSANAKDAASTLEDNQIRHRRPIPTNIITLSVKTEPAMAKKRILNEIQNLLLGTPNLPLFRSVGMKLPMSWLEFISFIESLRIHGPNDYSNLDKKMIELNKKNMELTVDAMHDDEPSKDKEVYDDEPSEDKEEPCFQLLPNFLARLCEKGGYNDTANQKQTDYDGVPYPYIRKEKLTNAWISYVERQDTENKEEDESTGILTDVLDLMKAQGDVVIYGDLVFLDPAFSAFVMKALTNHTMTKDTLEKSQTFKDYVSDPSCPCDYGKLIKSFSNFFKHGEVNIEVLKYLFRNLPIDSDDYDRILRMLVDTFAIFLSTTELDSSNGTHPVVLFNLPNKPDYKTIQDKWPSVCPKDEYHYEVRFEFPLGCPSSLAGHFAASVHKLGICLSAHINGALILVKESKSKIYARLEQDEAKVGGYKGFLSLAIRSHTENLHKVDKSNFWRTVQFLESEKKEKYQGLIYRKMLLCPQCIKEDIISTYEWDDEICTECSEDLDAKNIFGNRSTFTETVHSDIMNSNRNNTATTQVIAHILATEKRNVLLSGGEAKTPLVMMSARFNKDKYEAMARALASELRKKGVNVYVVDAGFGDTFGDKTIYGMYNMVAMICFCSPNYGQKTAAIYSSFGELKCAAENGITLVPIKMGDVWPPVPPEDTGGGFLGPAQNKFVFSADLLYNDWSQRDWDAVKCAEETKDALEKMEKCPMIEQTK